MYEAEDSERGRVAHTDKAKNDERDVGDALPGLCTDDLVVHEWLSAYVSVRSSELP